MIKFDVKDIKKFIKITNQVFDGRQRKDMAVLGYIDKGEFYLYTRGNNGNVRYKIDCTTELCDGTIFYVDYRTLEKQVKKATGAFTISPEFSDIYTSCKYSYYVDGIQLFDTCNLLSIKNPGITDNKEIQLQPVDRAFFDALVATSSCTEEESMRYALSYIAVEGNNVVATDGHMLFLKKIQNTLSDEIILVPYVKLFASKDLQNCQIGYKQNTLQVVWDSFVLELKTGEGRYPNYQSIIDNNRSDSAISFTITEDDAKFLLSKIDIIPMHYKNTVIFGIENNTPFLREYRTNYEDHPTDIELRLSESKCECDDRCILFNKDFIKTLFDCGFRDIEMDKDNLLYAKSGDDVIVIMPMTGNIVKNNNLTVYESK